MKNMAQQPLISVCIPFYNAGQYIKECLESVMNQTFQSFELILINDGSTDNSLEIVKEIDDERIHYIECEHDYIHSLNTGLQAARGKYIARMDADDIMLPERLQIQYDFMEAHPDIAVCGAGMQFFGKRDGEFIPETSSERLAIGLILYCPLSHPTTIIRKSFLQKHNIAYDADYIYAEDYKLWTEIVKYGKLANIPQVLLKYRISDTQLSNTHTDQQGGLSRLIRREITEYYLSLLSTQTPLGQQIKQSLLPVIDKLNDLTFFTSEEYFQFMHALVRGLVSRKLIKLSYDE